ncbi:MAG: glycosyltransferase family 4 protein, partial [Caldilineaceae bacterium]|nr:glycosyltransferase family 4 protein [Caldilineaceae bacterium]
MNGVHARIGFVSTRLAGTDGVSLEVQKWVDVLAGMGHESFFFAGECDWPAERSLVVPEAHFQHPEVLAITRDLFDDRVRTPQTSDTVHRFKEHLKQQLYHFTERFAIDILIAENVLAIPMHVPLGLAVAEFVAETSIPTIGHHHDFAWERPRFALNAAEDYLNAAFPPTLRSVHHVVINSFAQRQLALRRGVSSTIVPNVMNFQAAPPNRDGIVAQVRERLNIASGEYMLLQPTRIVPRKRIERAIELAKRLKVPCVLVISHASVDEGAEYADHLRQMIDLFGIEARFAAGDFGMERKVVDGKIERFALADAYLAADLVTYPSAVEGFGNAFLEAIYYRRPLVVSAYEIYRLDIKPKGFKVIEFDDFVTQETVERARELLLEPALVDEITDFNYRLGRSHYSFANLE